MFQSQFQKQFSDRVDLQKWMIHLFFLQSKNRCFIKNVASNDFRYLKDIDFLTTILVGGGGNNGKER